MTKSVEQLFSSRLLQWYAINKRSLPWRDFPRDPYKILVCELMLQQTQVSRVLPKYKDFIQKWPTFKKLAAAPQADVVIAWSGLGYNRRARYLWETANIITHQYGGKFPTDPEKIQELPGIGPYTARAVRVFGLGEQTYMVDVNIRRILSRVLVGIESASPAEVDAIAARVIPQNRSDAWHQGLMDFGSAVCSSSPHCDVCPLVDICVANREAIVAGCDSYAVYLQANPVRRKGKSLPFRKTNRYFRGRIIEYVRSGGVPMAELRTYIVFTCQLKDVVRFGMIIEDLMKEKLIRIEGSTVMLQ